MFKEYPLLPDRNGNYATPDLLRLPIPFRIADFRDKKLFQEVFLDESEFVAFNNEKEVNFTEYYLWLRDDLGVKPYSLIDLGEGLGALENRNIDKNATVYDELIEYYHFCKDYMGSTYYGGSRSGLYEISIREKISDFWELLRRKPIIMNMDGNLIPAYVEKKENVYLGSSSSYANVLSSAIVDKDIAKDFLILLRDGFQIAEFDNMQYVKEKVLKKYTVDSSNLIAFETEDTDKEYKNDISQIIQIVEDAKGEKALNEINKMLCNGRIIRVIDIGGCVGYEVPSESYLPISEEGIDLKVFYSTNKDDDEWFCVNRQCVDVDYYQKKCLDIDVLKKLGIICTPFIKGPTEHEGRGMEHWHTASGGFSREEFIRLYPRGYEPFYPMAEIDMANENILFIQKNENELKAFTFCSLILGNST